MQYLLEISVNKDKFLLDILKHFRFVKTRPLTKENVELINEFRQSIEEVKLAKKGKVKLKNAKDLLNEL